MLAYPYPLHEGDRFHALQFEILTSDEGVYPEAVYEDTLGLSSSITV